MEICRDTTALPSGWSVQELDLLISEAFAEYTGLNHTGNQLCFVFSAAVDVPTFDAVLAAYTPGELEVRICWFNSGFDSFYPPLDYDFGLLDLEKEKVMQAGDHGDYSVLNYYDGFDPVSGYGPLVCKREYSVIYHTSPMLRIEAIETIRWMRANGQPHPVFKTITRNYIGQRWTDFLEGKRKQIVEWLRHWIMTAMFHLQGQHGIPVGSSAVMAFGAAWFTTHEVAISSYVISYDVTGLLNAIAGDTTAFLDAEVPASAQVPGLAAGKTFREMINDEILY